MVNFTLPSTTIEMISISTSQYFCSWKEIFNLRQPMAFLSLNLYDILGLAPSMNGLFWGPGDFPESYSNRDTSWNAWNRHSGSVMVITEILLSNMKSPSREYVKWHSHRWPTVTSQPIRHSTNFITLIPRLTFTELWVVFMEHLQRVWHASRDRLPFRTPGSAPPPPILGLACAPIVGTRFLEFDMSLLGFSLRIPLGTFSILLCHRTDSDLFLFSCRDTNLMFYTTYLHLWWIQPKIYWEYIQS